MRLLDFFSRNKYYGLNNLQVMCDICAERKSIWARIPGHRGGIFLPQAIEWVKCLLSVARDRPHPWDRIVWHPAANFPLQVRSPPSPTLTLTITLTLIPPIKALAVENGGLIDPYAVNKDPIKKVPTQNPKPHRSHTTLIRLPDPHSYGMRPPSSTTTRRILY